MQIQYLGKVSIDTLINVNKDLVLNFTMRNEDFKLKEVTVTATNSRSGKSTSSHISRSAMDHMQATSLYDVMSLMPGGISQNPKSGACENSPVRPILHRFPLATRHTSIGLESTKRGFLRRL